MRTRLVLLSIVALFSLTVLLGCNGMITLEDGDSSSRDTDITNSLGEAHLSYSSRSETVSVRNSASDAAIRDIQVLGLNDNGNSLYVAADPNQRFHPVITSGESSSYSSNRRVYLTPTDQHLGTNATSYQTVNGGQVYDLASEYGTLAQRTTVSGLRSQLASLAYGHSAGLVVCLDQPATSYTGTIDATEVTQRSNTLSSAFQAIGWQYIYTSRGFSTNQNLNIWVVDPYRLRIASGSADALNDTLIVIVMPTSGSTNDVLPSSLRVEVTWDAPVDLDLHLVRDGADLYDATNDCYWKYLEQNWGDSYRMTDNARLLYDNQAGYGPETAVIDEMTPGDRYTIAIDYWGDANEQPTNTATTATVRVWTMGNSTPRVFTVYGLSYGAPENGQYKIVCDVDGSTGETLIANRQLTRSLTRSIGKKPR